MARVFKIPISVTGGKMPMIRVRPLIAVLLVLTLSGCGNKTPNLGSDTGSTSAATTKGDTTSQNTTGQNSNDKTTEKTATDKPSTTNDKQGTGSISQPAPVQPMPKVQGVRLNFDVLDKLSNKKLSWWISLNQEHKTPAIPADIKALIDKNDGIYVGDTTKKTVYLTFDEGYENGYTAKILDTLKANNAKAVFFVTGPYIKQNADLVKRMLDEGHLVGNHTINHPSLPDKDNTTLEKELTGLEDQFVAQFGKGFKYMRPPMGEYSERTLAACKQLGYKTIFWSFAYLDWDVNNQKGTDYAHKMVMDNLHNGAIYLLHAVSKDNAEALDRIIKDIRAEGYTINLMDL